jgi:hypothetical protein
LLRDTFRKGRGSVPPGGKPRRGRLFVLNASNRSPVTTLAFVDEALSFQKG